MLERTKACLNSRARETVRCAHATAVRSRRTLHSTFWSHGAGALELPPYMLSMKAPPNLPCRHDPRPQHTARNHDVVNPPSSTDRPCLDFLYPPQTLAFLHRTSTCSQTFERWESRNARRLPDGSLQTIRSISNARWAKHPRAVTADQVIKRFLLRHRQALEMMRTKRLDATAAQGKQATSVYDGIASTKVARGLTVELEKANERGKVTAQLFLDLVSSSQGRLATTPEGPAKRLVDSAWKTYNALEPRHRDDDRLKIEFICWLAPAGVRTRACIALYNTLPRSAKTLAVYRAILAVFLRHGLWAKAVQTHKEALKTLENSEALTVDFFRAAVLARRWHMAMHIEAQHRIINTNAQREMFWVNVTDIPQLLSLALELQTYLHGLERASTANDGIRAFCAQFFKEAFIQEYMSRGSYSFKRSYRRKSASLPLRNIGQLAERLSILGPEQDSFVEQLLLALIQRPKTYGASRIHSLVHRLYLLLKSKSHQPSEEVMAALIQHYCEAHGARAVVDHTNIMMIDAVVSDYEKGYGPLSRECLGILLRQCAYEGMDEQLQHWMDYFEKHHPGYKNIQPYLWTRIYVYAQRANHIKALEEFSSVERMARENGAEADARSYNALIRALTRVDDLEAAVDILSAMVQCKVKPDVYTYHPIMDMLSSRGDTAGILNFIAEIEEQAPGRMDIAYFGSLLVAYMKRGETDQAEELMSRIVDGVRARKIQGSLTHVFRRLMFHYASQRNVPGVTRTFDRMQAEGVKPDAAVYGALMKMLCIFRHSNEAYSVLRDFMPLADVVPTANEYSIVMQGFNDQQMFDSALQVHERMERENIRQSIETRAAYIRAKAGVESKELMAPGRTRLSLRKERRAGMPLSRTIDEVRKLVRLDQGREVANSSALIAAWPRGIDDVSGAYFQKLIRIHGAQRCFDAVKELVELYLEFVQRQSRHAMKLSPPFRILAALMVAHVRAKNHKEVERCWSAAKDLADKMTPTIQPDVIPTVLGLQNPAQDGGDAAELPEDISTQPTSARATYLGPPLSQYMASLALRGRVKDLLELVPRLIAEGYMLDNESWNRLVRFLCRREPPFALVAFVLTERFLMPGFKGWARGHGRQVVIRGEPNQSAIVENMQFTRTRYLKRAEFAPQYPTLVLLARALAQLRALRVVGADRKGPDVEKHPELQRYVGTPQSIYDQAVRTVKAIDAMPIMAGDRMQAKELPDWQPRVLRGQ